MEGVGAVQEEVAFAVRARTGDLFAAVVGGEDLFSEGVGGEALEPDGGALQGGAGGVAEAGVGCMDDPKYEACDACGIGAALFVGGHAADGAV